MIPNPSKLILVHKDWIQHKSKYISKSIHPDLEVISISNKRFPLFGLKIYCTTDKLTGSLYNIAYFSYRAINVAVTTKLWRHTNLTIALRDIQYGFLKFLVELFGEEPTIDSIKEHIRNNKDSIYPGFKITRIRKNSYYKKADRHWRMIFSCDNGVYTIAEEDCSNCKWKVTDEDVYESVLNKGAKIVLRHFNRLKREIRNKK